jgi:lipoprotein-anchoring transpeptidase ErfK/SrfK
VPWNLEFKPGYYIHGTYWHNKFGIEPMSHGCVNVSIDNAKKIYDFLQIGDQITIYGKTPPGQVVN